MTYDILNKASKAELITWIKNNILLPNISDEQFLYDIQFDRLMEENKRLLEKSRVLHEKIQMVPNEKHFELMQLMVESSKLNEKIEENSQKLNALMKNHDEN